MEISSIHNLKLGCTLKGFFLCHDKHLRYTRKNDLYLDLALVDNTGYIRAKMWNNIDTYKKKIFIYGIAQNKNERDLVLKEAKQILDIKNVVASILLVEDLRIQKD